MGTHSNHTGDLRSLDREIRHLQRRRKALEKDLTERVGFLQEHYSSMMVKSVLPIIRDKTGVPLTIVELLTQNERFRGNIGRLADHLLDKISDGIEFISDKLDKKKKED
jgi:hypothetical protein